LCVVGDASQSIYAWRGANFRNILDFERDFPTVRVFQLEQNYRSSQTILDAAFAVISKNTSHPILKLWTEKPAGKRIYSFEARNEQNEALFIVEELYKQHYAFSDAAILYRTNAQSRVIEEVLLHEGIPYILYGGVSFYQRKEVKDVLSYLRLILNPTDVVAKERIEKIGKRRAEKFFEIVTSETSAESTLELLEKVLRATGYLELYDKDNPEDISRLENIKELRSVANEFPKLWEFLENVALIESAYTPSGQAKKDQNHNAVTLMTLHAAKGLEFPVVFMVGMEEGIFPHSRSLLDSSELEEERRLCYVGITRAKEKLYLTYTQRRMFFGTRTSNTISRFVADIPEDLLDSVTQTDFATW
jgi:DNA helicase-2/ATP-dependent DNA helicase PcrA